MTSSALDHTLVEETQQTHSRLACRYDHTPSTHRALKGAGVGREFLVSIVVSMVNSIFYGGTNLTVPPPINR